MESDKQILRKIFLKFGHFALFLMPQQPKFSMEFKFVFNFEIGPPKEQSCEVWLKFVRGFKRRWSFKLNVNDGRRTESDQNRSTWASGSGDLKIDRKKRLSNVHLHIFDFWKRFNTNSKQNIEAFSISVMNVPRRHLNMRVQWHS